MSNRTQETVTTTSSETVEVTHADSAHDSASAWSPLRSPVYRGLWLASIVSTGGTMMQDTGAAWLMTSLAPSPLMVALMQTAASLPVFLLALPAGALADIVDRRRLLLLLQATMCLLAATLGVLVITGAITPWLLLLFTFLIGAGATLSTPASQANLGEIVPHEQIPKAVTLNSVTVNIARVWGPLLGGLLVASGRLASVFLLNALSFLGTLGVLHRWRRTPRQSHLPRERFLGAITNQVRYARYSPLLRAALIRASAFVFCGSGVWALLPLLARGEMQLNAAGFGALMACVGVGALGGASLLPWMHRRVSVDALTVCATAVFASAAIALAYLRGFYVLCPVMVVAGVAWITLVSSFSVAVGSQGPAWAKARVFGVYLLVFQGGTAAGSLAWGIIADRVGISATLSLIAAGLVAGLPLAFRYRLRSGEGINLQPARAWSPPPSISAREMERGPVMVMVEYMIDPSRAAAFDRAMRAVELERRRDGAFFWGLFVNPADPSRYVEFFVEESWVEHLRHHERVTVADHDVQRQAQSFHIGAEPPVTTHLVAERDARERR